MNAPGLIDFAFFLYGSARDKLFKIMEYLFQIQVLYN